MAILDKINCPTDIKKLSLAELGELAEEIRAFLIENVSKTGGHLAPNLGVVELTLAMHYVFDSPQDKFIWDVGHQSYVHKILTGRKDKFGTLRQYQGICGFPNRNESEHDAFGTGHASTSISAALGMVVARDLLKQDYNILAVIGDGALTGGMALEALNNAGDINKKFIVILNDNEMSIAKNVGAMSEYLVRMRSEPKYARIKRDVEEIIKSIPSIGPKVLQTAERVKNSLKYLLVPGMLFEDLGFTYIGPIDGHNTEALIAMLEESKKINSPVLLHVLTHKGKGYEHAEQNPDKFHGISPFEVATGCKISANPNGLKTYTEVFSDTVMELADKDPRIVTITAAMPDGTGLSKFAQKYPERFFDVGIAEQHATTLAAGMAAAGLKPVLALYSTFAQRAYDQIVHDICLQKLPVILALDRAGLVGDDGATHHGVFDLSYLSHIPNLTIMAPKDEGELRDMFATALSLDAPVAIRYPRGNAPGADTSKTMQVLPVGKAEVLKQGKDKVCLFAIGAMVCSAQSAAEQLQQEGLDVSVVNARFAKPLDKDLILSLVNTGNKLVVLEENAQLGGIGSQILQILEQNKCLAHNCLLSLAIPDRFVTHGDKVFLHKELGLDVPSIVKKVRDFIK